MPATIHGDELHITKLVYNLIDNAIKYSPSTIDITVATRNDGDSIALSVSQQIGKCVIKWIA